MMAAYVIFYSEECDDARSRARLRRTPVLEWFDTIPRPARIGLIARLELLATRGVGLGAPHVVSIGERLKAVWCRCEGTKHLIIYAVQPSPALARRATAVLLHAVSIDESIHIAQSATTPSRAHQASGRPASFRTVSSVAALAPSLTPEERRTPSPWPGIVAEADFALANERLVAFESAPELHVLLAEQ